jgi:hydroxymethylglutaryl-CoA reductase (NADPH)
MLLKRLYTLGSLQNIDSAVQFSIKNRLANVELTGVQRIALDGAALSLDSISLRLEDGRTLAPAQISPRCPLPFPLRATVTVQTKAGALIDGRHDIEFAIDTKPFGQLHFTVDDTVSEAKPAERQIPRDESDDYGEAIIQRRQALVEQTGGHKLRHLNAYSFDAHVAKGNCENFIGAAQVPIGIAGPLRINGEYAQGDFLIPLATSEGTLVASHNRGIKVLNMCGGVKTTVVADAMQRAPVFVFEDARRGRDFVEWVQANLDSIRTEAEASSKIAKLQYIDPYIANKFVFLRFNYSTGDAAGQNMVGRATFAACNWILDHFEGVTRFYLESNFATDKKASQVNIMRTRGKRVTAEATISRDVLVNTLRVEPETLAYHYGVANIAAFLSGANNNGLQSANGITAMFIATGQDVANVAESSAGVLYAELTPAGDFYLSLTIPSLIVATYGGGTGLATQRECLELLGCYGPGNVKKLAEIIAGLTLAGEISLGAAISSSDWVSAHEKMGRHR